VVYHLTLKSLPSGTNVLRFLVPAYAVSSCVSLSLLLFLPKFSGGSGLSVNLPTLLLGLSVVGIELGFFFAYRVGWTLNTAAIVSNAMLTALLCVIGAVVFNERLGTTRMIGICLTAAGVYLMTRPTQ
jgi:drug/metabolite transporter (DMT)-like permease